MVISLAAAWMSSLKNEGHCWDDNDFPKRSKFSLITSFLLPLLELMIMIEPHRGVEDKLDTKIMKDILSPPESLTIHSINRHTKNNHHINNKQQPH